MRGPSRWRPLFLTLVVGSSVPALGAAVACSGQEFRTRAGLEPAANAVARVSSLAPRSGVAPPAVEPTPSVMPAPPPAASAAPGVETVASADAPAAASAVNAAPLPDVPAPPGDPLELIATARETLVYAEPSRSATKVGYLRFGARVRRDARPRGYEGCALGWYAIAPYGFVCVGNAASRDLEQPLAALAKTRPDRDAGLPYAYGRSKPVPPPLYTHLPTAAEASALEGATPRSTSGFGDLPVEPLPELLRDGRPLPEPFGYARAEVSGTPRALPNSAFALLEVLEHDGRRFGVTTDLELVPLDRLTRVEPSTFHGVAFDEHTSLPLAFVRSRHAWLFAGSPERGLRPLRALSYREAVSLSGKTAKFDHLSYLETRDGAWLRDVELVHVSDTAARPAGVREGRTWVHVSIGDQTLVAYVGTRAVYATLVSTGAGGLGDPETTHATPRGEFLIHTKHVTSSMNGDELGDEFDLRDVPYVEYFTQGYAFHAAYWHDAFGAAHSHGCVNLSPLDARWLFHFTEPAVPQGWHGAFSREGTLVSITP